MSFPPHIAEILDGFAIQPATKAALYELYIVLGDEALEVFGDLAEGIADPASLGIDVTTAIRAKVVEAYLRRNHPKWLEGLPTASLWHPRELEGRASGVAVPLGELSEVVRSAVPPDQPVPDGIAMVGRNAHSGGRLDTVSFEVVARDLDDAIALALAAGQQHTLPGSVGETSASFDAGHAIALIWEIQPNVFKPDGERNRSIAKTFRRHRNWHVVSLAIALEWMRVQGCATFVLRGEALALTHEMNPAAPLSALIASHHDTTVARTAAGLGLVLEPVTDGDEFLLLESMVMNHALRKHVLLHGAAGLMFRIRPAGL